MRPDSPTPAPRRITTLLANERGFALEATLMVLVLVSVLVAASVASYVMVQKSGSVDYRATRVSYAAEAGSDAVVSQLAQRMTDGIITTADISAVTLPTLSGFTFATPTVTMVGAPVPKTITSGSYAGLVGLNQQIDIGITATDPAGNRGQVIISANAQSIPLFQFGVFYNEDLEIHNGQNMDFAGWVHTNSNLYLTPGGSAVTSFHDLITTPDSVFWQRKAYNERNANVRIDNASAVAQTLNFDSRSNPGSSFVSASTSLLDGRLMTGVSGVQPLSLPLPAGMPPIQLVQPRSGGDTPDVQGVKFAWKATAHLTVDMAQLANVNTCAGITILGSPLPTGASCAMFSGLPQGFWEGRENIGADVFQIDMGALQTWASANAARDYSIIYVTFTNVNAGTNTRDYPVVRIRNGATLRAPVTVATDRPLYLWGNYNTGTWYPSSFIADAITFQSSAWTDAAHPLTGHTAAGGGTDWHNPAQNTANDMTVYAAIAAGHSATPCDWQRSGCVVTTPPPLSAGTSNYGGGLENFPRFLENFSGRTVTYRGSLVSLFQSQYANRRRWSWTSYYGVPTRDWRFDLRFKDPTQLPPGTPVVGSVFQTSFRPVY